MSTLNTNVEDMIEQSIEEAAQTLITINSEQAPSDVPPIKRARLNEPPNEAIRYSSSFLRKDPHIDGINIIKKMFIEYLDQKTGELLGYKANIIGKNTNDHMTPDAFNNASEDSIGDFMLALYRCASKPDANSSIRLEDITQFIVYEYNVAKRFFLVWVEGREQPLVVITNFKITTESRGGIMNNYVEVNVSNIEVKIDPELGPELESTNLRLKPASRIQLTKITDTMVVTNNGMQQGAQSEQVYQYGLFKIFKGGVIQGDTSTKVLYLKAQPIIFIK